VCPGYTETPLLESAVANIADKTGRPRDAARADLARFNPQGRLIEPDEVAATVLWLCSPGAEAINGQAIAISGGEA
jgi:NAD(P)-dependent dehydrogenase (short-subunit alcohol dehydrogenase family)